MSTAKKMFLSPGQTVPCVGLPSGLVIDDLKLHASTFKELAKDLAATGSSSAFVFVVSNKDLQEQGNELVKLWEQKQNFWLFYPKKPHLETDLSRDVSWMALKKLGIQGTRQVGISDQWSCMYCKNS